MRILHVSDTHVGYSAYNKVTAEGLNQRERDFFDAFTRAIDLALEERVEVVLHSGDVFDSVRPTNRAVAHVMAQVKRLGDAGIPFVVIAGNHETPKLKETGSVLHFLDFLPHTHAVYKGRYEVVRIGDTAFHCVPHAVTEEKLHEELAAVAPDPDARFNVMTFHAGVVGVADFRTGEFNEHTVPTSFLREDMDYVAVGHYHKPTQLQGNAYYAGSTERCSFGEAAEPKGCYVVDLAKGTAEFRDLSPREMVTLPPVRSRELTDAEVPEAVYARLAEADLENRIVRLKVEDLPPHVYATLDFQRIRKLLEPALHGQLTYDIAREDGHVPRESSAMRGLSEEFDAFYEDVPVDGLDRDRLRERAVAFLDAATEGSGDA